MKKQLLFQFFLIIVSFGCQNNPTLEHVLNVDVRTTSTTEPIVTQLLPNENILSLISNKCEKFGEAVYSLFIDTYNDKGCKLPLISPDRKYLAYVTLSRQNDNDGVFYTDAVQIISLDEETTEKEIHVSIKKDYIARLEWDSDSHRLMVWEAVWEGDYILSIYDVAREEELAKMRTDSFELQWNSQKTAFYITHSGDYGRDVCVVELNGFDFATQQSFPSLYVSFDITDLGQDIFGISYATKDTIKIKPQGWSPDGKKLYLAITPLTLIQDRKDQYNVEPTQVGIIQFSNKNEAIYVSLAKDPTLDHSFIDGPNFEIISKLYSPATCP